MAGKSLHPPAHYTVAEQRDFYAKRCDDLRHEIDCMLVDKFQDESAFTTQTGILAKAYGLSPAPAHMLCRLWRGEGRPVGKTALALDLPAVSVNSEDRDFKVVDVYVWRLRKMVGADNLITHWGLGYSLSPELVAQIDDLMARNGYAQRGGSVNAHVTQPLTMPHNIEAEQALIGCLLFDNAAFNRIEGMVEPDQFYEPFHQKLFGQIIRLIKSGKAAEPITLIDRFKDDRAFGDLGGVRYLMDLIEGTPPSYAAPDYAGVIAEAAARRVLIRTAQAIMIDATNISDSSERVIARCEALLADAARGAGVEDAWVDGSALADRLSGIMDGTIAQQSVKTGFHGFDERCGGIVKGRMNVFAGRPGMGKSAYAVAMMQAMAQSGLACGFFSLEMDISELALRMGCGLAFDRYGPRERNPVYFDAQRQKLALDQKEALHLGRQALRELPIWFDDRSGLTPSQIVPAAKRLIRRWEKDRLKPGMIVVDHLHIVKPETNYGNRVVEVGEVSGALRDLAKETGVAIVALCQLSRANEARGNADKRPQMSDLRWSGEIEADAAQIIFIHRPEKYLKEPEDKGVDAMDKYIDDLERWRDKALLINVKNRGGPSDFDHEINVSLKHNAFWE